MIPRIIHYCWLSDDPIPAELNEYMNTWKKYLTDYEIIHWNFNRFPKEKSIWVKQAFEQKKYAFAADYIRLYALYHYGGIYLDTDVEVLKSFDPFLDAREMLCREIGGDPEVAAFGVEKGCEWIKVCLDRYQNRPFIKEDGSFDVLPLPKVIQNTLIENGYIFRDIDYPSSNHKFTNKEIPILPYEYFSPKSYSSGKLYKTELTVSIHHFKGSWLPWYTQLEKKIFNSVGLDSKNISGAIISRLEKLYHKIKFVPKK